MKTNKFFYLILVIVVATVFSSCKKDYVDWEKLRKAELSDRAKYIADHNITTKPKASGLYYIETKAGTGLGPGDGKTVTVKYTGKLLNGTKFDSNDSFEFVYNVDNVIKGWTEGLSYMKKGGKATLIIPNDLAYGAYGYEAGGIPKYSTLVFDIELINVQ